MSDDKLHKIYADIHLASAELLLARIKDGSASASDLAVARAILKDNNITVKPVKGSPMGNLAASLPQFDDHEGVTFQ